MSEYLTTREVAELLRTSESTLRFWRHIDRGPNSFRIGKRVLYDRRDVEQFIEDARAEGSSGRALA
ncbi:DNA-binding protein [Actinobacteria bacterium YIM 96077]|uniref:DNA-binding protein n=1 Tax=Phytoactinopolyspora halophila TaxID=1981511 RepID=A0A329QSP7_9ACTN|nr:helix-turn-helix domain-containing protein [Phytoactinopolyspora halophila]AYY11352.1 DNA-binding protein [Actinobacteria bacterium YIM 96077]RAW14699.1 DNA-binding protein [Phytoactinopolyspora halophila]